MWGRIDSNTDDVCPKCGASYKKNKKFVEWDESKNEEEKIISDIRKGEYKEHAKISSRSKYVFIAISVIFIIFFLFNIVRIFNFNSDITDFNLKKRM